MNKIKNLAQFWVQTQDLNQWIKRVTCLETPETFRPHSRGPTEIKSTGIFPNETKIRETRLKRNDFFSVWLTTLISFNICPKKGGRTNEVFLSFFAKQNKVYCLHDFFAVSHMREFSIGKKGRRQNWVFFPSVIFLGVGFPRRQNQSQLWPRRSGHVGVAMFDFGTGWFELWPHSHWVLV